GRVGQAGEGGGRRVHDAHEGVNGRRRHLLVDPRGVVLRVVVSAADVQDREGARLLAHALRLWGPALPRLSLVWADAAYGGPLADDLRQQMRGRLEVVKRSEAQPRSALARQAHRRMLWRTVGWGGGRRPLR